MPKTPPKPPTDPADVTPPAPAAPGSALTRAPSTDESAELATLAAAGFTGDDVDDGLSEVSMSDLRTPYKLFNLQRADGVARIAKDQFLDTIDRAVTNELHLVLLDMHKTNLYEVYNQKDERNTTRCKSSDRITGTWQADGGGHALGTVRPCKGCPDAEWRTETDGQGNKKRTVPCSEVWNVGSFDLDTQRVCLIKFKKTSLDAIRGYVQAHHVGRMPKPGGKRGNIPLCVYKVRASLEMSKNGNYATPKLERGDMLSASDIRVMHETAEGLRETFAARMAAADESAAGDGGAGGGDDGDASFDVSTMGGTADGSTRGSEAFVE